MWTNTLKGKGGRRKQHLVCILLCDSKLSSHMFSAKKHLTLRSVVFGWPAFANLSKIDAINKVLLPNAATDTQIIPEFVESDLSRI